MEVQLKLNLDNLDKTDLRIREMEERFNALSDSMGKVRRRMFQELGEVKKMVAFLQAENSELKAAIRQKLEYEYLKDDYLVRVV